MLRVLCGHAAHPQLVVLVVRIGGLQKVELDIVPLVCDDALLKLHACSRTADEHIELRRTMHTHAHRNSL